MGEQDVDTTGQLVDDTALQPDATEDDAAQGEQQEASSEAQVTEVTDPVTNEAAEETEPGNISEDDGGTGTSEDTLLLSGENTPANTNQSGDFTVSAGDDGSNVVTVGDGAGTSDGESSDGELTFDDGSSDANIISADTSETGDEDNQELVAVDAGSEDDATPVIVGSGQPPEDPAGEIVYPEPAVPPDDGSDDDVSGNKPAPVYEVQVDPRIAAIQPQADLTHLLADDEDDDDREEEERQMIVADPEVERPRVENQPAPGAGPIPPRPGRTAELDVFDLRLAGDADASRPAIVTPDLKTAGDADGAEPELSGLKLGGDADGTDPESPRLAGDVTLRFDLDDAKDVDSKETGETPTKIPFEDAGAFVDRGATFDSEPLTTARGITSASVFNGALFPVADDEEDGEPEDDAADDV